MSSPLAGVSSRPKGVVYRFDGFELRSETRELFLNSERIRVPDQSVQILIALLETPHEIVTRDCLRERLWPEGTFVDFDHSLNAAIKRLRAAIGDNAEQPQYIETLPKRGYRFLGRVTAESLPGREPRVPGIAPTAPDARRSRRVLFWSAAGALAILIGIAMALLSSSRSTHPQAPSGSLNPPRSNEAYELYLRSLGDKLEPPANAHAIELLERATKLDPTSARAWYELGLRYHYESLTNVGGQGLIQQAIVANRRSLELDPNYLPARRHQVTLDVESGELAKAYDFATATLEAHPQSSEAHFGRSYVLRYAGYNEEAANECEIAYRLDSTDPSLRSCAWVYILLQRYERARAFIALDPLSTNAKYRVMDIALATRNDAEALRVARTIGLAPNSYPEVRLVEAVLAKKPANVVQHWAIATEIVLDRETDPESYYVAARYLAWAGKPDAGLRQLRRAIENNYCSYPVMDADPLLANVRSTHDYAEIRQAGVACHSRFAKFAAR